jgi:exopolyphosphatase/guanosine-5'-triphosphate,3'-diphosphate pyrophosphatase
MRRAVISIGTNTTRLLVIDEGARPILHKARGTRIGEGLHGSGPIGAAAAKRTLDAIEELLGLARAQDASITGIATSALRRADDAAAFMAEFEKRAGAPLRILSGEEEARCSFLGAAAGLGITAEVGVLDAGGGSSEYAFGSGSDVRSSVSCEIGAVRLTELVPELAGEHGAVPTRAVEEARSRAAQALAPLERQPKPPRLIAVGGTGFAAGALIEQSDDREALSGQSLSGTQLDTLFDALIGEDLGARRRRPHMQVQRADILPAGILVVRTAMAILKRSEITLSSFDLLYGYLRSLLDAPEEK